MIRKVVYGISVLSLTLGSLGCEVKPSTAPRLEVQADQLKDFDLPQTDSIVLTSNQLFLWPEKIQADQTTRVFDISRQIDKNTKIRINFEDRQNLLQSDPAVEDTDKKIKSAKRDLNSKKAALNSSKYSLTVAKRNLTKAEADLVVENARAAPDAVKVTSLQGQITQLKSQVANLENAQIPQLEIDRNLLQKQVDDLTADLDTLQTKNQVELDNLSADIQSTDKLGKSLIDEVMGIVDPWYDMSQSQIAIRLKEEGRISISIAHWKLDSNPDGRDFSTEPNAAGVVTIQNVKYERHGGILDFDVLVYEDDQSNSPLRETFSFHVSRNNYQSGDGKICYLGDLIRKKTLKDGSIESRKGVAKLVDRNG
jgi:hypothetical protein